MDVVLLNTVNKEARAKLMFLLWRTWHLINDIIFRKGESPISASVEFLHNYITPMKPNNNLPALGKGKEISNTGPIQHYSAPQYDIKDKVPWSPPSPIG